MSRLTKAEATHSVSSLELFFDLVFVFAITQVTAFIAADPTGGGALRGLLLLCLVYFSWVAYSWLGTSTRVDDPAPTAAMLAALGAMFVVAILMPQWFAGGVWALVAVCCYIGVRALHLLLFRMLGSDSPELRRATARLAMSTGAAAVLLLAGAVVGGTVELMLVLAAVLIDPTGAFVGGGRGWYLAADHFAERHGRIVIIAIGESLIAVGLAITGTELSAQLLVLGLLGALVAALIYLLYFRRTAQGLEEALAASSGPAQARLGRDAYSYGHLLLLGGIIAMALALKKSALTVADDGLAGHLHGIAGPALATAGLLIVGGVLLIRLRAGLGATPLLAVGMIVVIGAGMLASVLPVGAVVLLAIVGLALAALPRGNTAEYSAG